MKWYSNKYRRHLLDMHIDDWSDEFLSEFSPESYHAMLKKAKVQVAMIYMQSHLGLCNWPTKTGKTHNHFKKKPDDIKKLMDLCRADGINVVGYYSLDFNQWAHDTHSEWRMHKENGKSSRENNVHDRSGLCCPNNLGYREFVFRQIDEMLDFFDMDAIFFDMLYWPHVCYCPACREKYMKENGKPLPHKNECTHEEWIEFCDARARWIGEWAQTVTDYVKSVDPTMPVEHNFSAATGGFGSCCRDGVADASEYVGGDLYGGTLEQSFVCSTYRNLSKNQPFEYMTGRCSPNLLAHTITKTEDELTQQVMITCAHHGAFLAIDAIDPVGTMDERVYEMLGRIFEKEAVYEPYLTGELIEDVGLFYNLDSAVNIRDNAHDMGFLHFAYKGRNCDNRTASIQAAKHLIAAHIPFGITSKGNIDKYKKYRTIIAPDINRLPEETVDALIKYVEDGGNLVFSGCDEKRLFETLIGGKVTGYTNTTKAYIYAADGAEEFMLNYNKKYPLPVDMLLPFVEGVAEENTLAYIELAYTDRRDGKRCASFHSDPPGVATKHPAIVEKTYGKGRVIWCAGSLEYHVHKDYGKLLKNILNRLCKKPYTVSSTAYSSVEIVSFKDGNKIRISAVNMGDFETLYTLPPFTVTVQCDSKNAIVKRLPDGAPVPYVTDGETITFTVENLRIMEMFEIEL